MPAQAKLSDYHLRFTVKLLTTLEGGEPNTKLREQSSPPSFEPGAELLP
ncbi:MAG: hypothetical protein KME25_31445 [Symplocastrum torsivum CPER-KK1]|uniref:Uncharacterized protein n=1 Tax=Symplocastrum torsivum CPER-KK1 TaxID=450513 RepID=A0A951PT57_9CYAN|nr:hypothetical protein [Symplocastrum torsivum CPER-KK1]